MSFIAKTVLKQKNKNCDQIYLVVTETKIFIEFFMSDILVSKKYIEYRGKSSLLTPRGLEKIYLSYASVGT